MTFSVGIALYELFHNKVTGCGLVTSSLEIENSLFTNIVNATSVTLSVTFTTVGVHEGVFSYKNPLMDTPISTTFNVSFK